MVSRTSFGKRSNFFKLFSHHLRAGRRQVFQDFLILLLVNDKAIEKYLVLYCHGLIQPHTKKGDGRRVKGGTAPFSPHPSPFFFLSLHLR